MAQVNVRDAEATITRLLVDVSLGTKSTERAAYPYLYFLKRFFVCILIRMMEKYNIISCAHPTDYQARYHAGTDLLRSIFGENETADLLQTVAADADTDKEVISMLFAGCDELIEDTGIDVIDLGAVFENFYNKDFDILTESLCTTSNRKENGMFFSSSELVQFMLTAVTEYASLRQLAKSNFIDPAMGGGIFIFELLDFMQSKRLDVKECLENQIYGIDKNPLLVEIVRISLWIKYADRRIDVGKLCKHFRAEDSLLLFDDQRVTRSSWSELFPHVFQNGGFDYVIGNPPWGKIKANVREFSLVSNDLAKDYQGANLKDKLLKSDSCEQWAHYQKRISLYAQSLKQSPCYKYQKYPIDNHTTGGDFDLYKYFLEVSFAILKDGGKLGFIIPASFYISESATGLRHLFLENGTIRYLVNFINKKRIFPIHSSYKFLLMIYAKHNGKKGAINRAVFNLDEPKELSDFEAFKKRTFVKYSVGFLDQCGPYWTVPEFRNESEKKLFEKLNHRVHTLNSKNKTPYRVSFSRELDMTLDSASFISCNTIKQENNGGLIPVYEGRMVNQFDSVHKTYVSGAGRTAKWDVNPYHDRKPLRAQFYVKKAGVSKEAVNGYRAGYCEITGQSNVRTVLASLIPPDAICGNKIPTCRFWPDNDIKYHLYWIGMANSFLVDWVMRKKITITINYFHWSQIPFPLLDMNTDCAKEIIAGAAIVSERMNGYSLSRFFNQKEDQDIIKYYEKFKLESTGKIRLTMDCIIAAVMEVTVPELIQVLFDFPALDQGKPGIEGDRRYNKKTATSYVTRDMLLFEYMKMNQLETSQNIDELFAHAGIDISTCTGKIRCLSERVHFYHKNDIEPYLEL